MTSADDGPHPRYTEELLDGLKEKGVHATFFDTVEHAELHPDIIKCMQEVVYVRPSYGSWDKSFEKELNMFPVLWTVDPLDWCSKDADRITEKIVSKVEEILFD